MIRLIARRRSTRWPEPVPQPATLTHSTSGLTEVNCRSSLSRSPALCMKRSNAAVWMPKFFNKVCPSPIWSLKIHAVLGVVLETVGVDATLTGLKSCLESSSPVSSFSSSLPVPPEAVGPRTFSQSALRLSALAVAKTRRSSDSCSALISPSRKLRCPEGLFSRSNEMEPGLK